MLQLEGFVFGVSLHSASLMIDLRCACLIKKNKCINNKNNKNATVNILGHSGVSLNLGLHFVLFEVKDICLFSM